MNATIYVGRWNLLPSEWEGINGLYEKNENEIRAEVARQLDEWAKDHTYEDNLMGAYSLEEFEEEFNSDNDSALHGTTYFIKIFIEGKSVIES